MNKEFIPTKERIRVRNKQIVALYKSGMSMDNVVEAMTKLGYSVSKTTVFFAVNGRYGCSEQFYDRRRQKKALKRIINSVVDQK